MVYLIFLFFCDITVLAYVLSQNHFLLRSFEAKHSCSTKSGIMK